MDRKQWGGRDQGHLSTVVVKSRITKYLNHRFNTINKRFRHQKTNLQLLNRSQD